MVIQPPMYVSITRQLILPRHLLHGRHEARSWPSVLAFKDTTWGVGGEQVYFRVGGEKESSVRGRSCWCDHGCNRGHLGTRGAEGMGKLHRQWGGWVVRLMGQEEEKVEFQTQEPTFASPHCLHPDLSLAKYIEHSLYELLRNCFNIG